MPRLTSPLKRRAKVKPTFGQVWEFNGSKLMLLTTSGHGEWRVAFLHPAHGFVPVTSMYGLHDDSNLRINGYTLLSEDI